MEPVFSGEQGLTLATEASGAPAPDEVFLDLRGGQDHASISAEQLMELSLSCPDSRSEDSDIEDGASQIQNTEYRIHLLVQHLEVEHFKWRLRPPVSVSSIWSFNASLAC